MKVVQFFIILMATTNIFTMDTNTRTKSFEDVNDLINFDRKDANRRGVPSNQNDQTSKYPFRIPTSQELIKSGRTNIVTGILKMCNPAVRDPEFPGSVTDNELFIIRKFNSLSQIVYGAGQLTSGKTMQFAYNHPKEACALGFVAASLVADRYINCPSCKGQGFTK